VADVIRYLSIVIGFLLIGLGIAFLLGRSLTFATPKLDRGGRTRTAWSMFVFGISYAVASFGCTIGPFVLTVLGSFTRDGTLSGVLMIVAYGLGMGLLLTTLTVTLALARGGLLRGLRSAMRWIDSVAGVLLILAGLYLVYYWWYDLVSDTGAKQVAGGGLSVVPGPGRPRRLAGSTTGAGPLALVLGSSPSPPSPPCWPGDRRRLDSGPLGRTTTRPWRRTVRPPMFAELLAHPGVEEVVELRGPFGFMAYHGGSLEEATDVIARAAAEASGASYYGVHQPADLQWHIPSTRSIWPSPPPSPLPRPRRRGITVHGYGRDGWCLLSSAATARWPSTWATTTAACLRTSRHRPRGHPPSSGLHRNPVNWSASGAQLSAPVAAPARSSGTGRARASTRTRRPSSTRSWPPRPPGRPESGQRAGAQGARRSMIQGASTESRR
jgi:hypothetical protein